jgi:hypothetical protein
VVLEVACDLVAHRAAVVSVRPDPAAVLPALVSVAHAPAASAVDLVAPAVDLVAPVVLAVDPVVPPDAVERRVQDAAVLLSAVFVASVATWRSSARRR